MLTKGIQISKRIGFLIFFFEKIQKKTLITTKFQHLALSFYSTPFLCLKTVFTFYSM